MDRAKGGISKEALLLGLDIDWDFDDMVISLFCHCKTGKMEERTKKELIWGFGKVRETGKI